MFWLPVCCAVGCSPDPACSLVAAEAQNIEARLQLPMNEAKEEGEARTLSLARAEELNLEVAQLKARIPKTAQSPELQAIVEKLHLRISALEGALAEFRAIDPEQLEGGIRSPSTMPIRRGVVMSKNRVIDLLKTADAICVK